MHAGVIRDMEQQKLRKDRQLDFEMQKALEKEYLKVQSVHDGSDDQQPGRVPGSTR
jgi:protein PET117